MPFCTPDKWMWKSLIVFDIRKSWFVLRLWLSYHMGVYAVIYYAVQTFVRPTNHRDDMMKALSVILNMFCCMGCIVPGPDTCSGILNTLLGRALG